MTVLYEFRKIHTNRKATLHPWSVAGTYVCWLETGQLCAPAAWSQATPRGCQAWVGSPVPQRGVTRVDTVSEKAGTITTRVCSAHKPHAWGLQGHSSRATALPCSGPQCPGNIWGIGSLLDRSAYVEPARTWQQDGGRWFWAPPRGTPRGGGRTGHRFDWTVVPGQPVWPGLVHLRGPALTPGMPGRPMAVTLQ